MKSIRNIALSALLSIGAFSTVTYVSCNPDACKDVVCSNGGTCVAGTCNCTVGYDGTTCQTEVRSTYFNTYKGNGVDSDGDTYTNFGMKFETRSSDAKNMTLTVLDNNNGSIVALNVILQSNTTFTIESKTDGTTTYTGTGTVDANKASLNLSINESGSVLTVTFTDMIKN